MLLDAIIKGRRDHVLWRQLKGWRYAHRGYHDKPQIPENSLPAFRRAIEHGWGAELDVHLLKDGTLAVFHDSQLARCTGEEGILEDLTYGEMKGCASRARTSRSQRSTRCWRCSKAKRR